MLKLQMCRFGVKLNYKRLQGHGISYQKLAQQASFMDFYWWLLTAEIRVLLSGVASQCLHKNKAAIQDVKVFFTEFYFFSKLSFFTLSKVHDSIFHKLNC